jgi:hypothetical protein
LKLAVAAIIITFLENAILFFNEVSLPCVVAWDSSLPTAVQSSWIGQGSRGDQRMAIVGGE